MRIEPDRPISQSLEEWLARCDENRPLPQGLAQPSLFDLPTPQAGDAL